MGGCTILPYENVIISEALKFSFCSTCPSENTVTEKRTGLIIPVALTAHHTPECRVMVRHLFFWDYLPISIRYFQYLRACLNKIMPHL
jgi:hypothetical protein